MSSKRIQMTTLDGATYTLVWASIIEDSSGITQVLDEDNWQFARKPKSKENSQAILVSTKFRSPDKV